MLRQSGHIGFMKAAALPTVGDGQGRSEGWI